MGKKVTNLKSVYLYGNAYEAKRDNKNMVRVNVFSDFMGKELVGTVYIPMTTYNLGFPKFQDAIKSRIKHDLNITFDHYISCGL